MDDKTVKIDAPTKDAFKAVVEEKFIDPYTETEKQRKAGDDFEDCLDQGKKVQDCKSKLESDSKDLGSKVTNKKELTEEIVARKELDAVDDEDECTDTEKESCKEETKKRAEKYSGRKGRKRVKRALNARRKAAEKWKSCEEAGQNTEIECCEKARDEFRKKGGVGRWEKCKSKAARILEDSQLSKKADKESNRKEMRRRVDKVRKSITGSVNKGTVKPERIKLKRRQAIEVSVSIKKPCTDTEAIKEIKSVEKTIKESLEKEITHQKDVTVKVIQDMEDDEEGQSDTCNCGWTAKFNSKKDPVTAEWMDSVAEKVQKETSDKMKGGRRLFLIVTEVSAAGSIDMNESDEDAENVESPELTTTPSGMSGGLLAVIIIAGLGVMALVIYGAIKMSGNNSGLASRDEMQEGKGGSVEMQVNPNPNDFLKNMKA